MGGSIFISYRRETDSAFAGRLYDHLEPSFGRERLFIDVDSIAPGEDFVAVLESWVAACDVLLALIGRGWLAATDEAGRRRLDNPDDFVRIEIGAALAQGKRVIPVLSDNTAMPRAEELPGEIKPLAGRNAIRLTHDRFKDDAERLVRALEKALADAEAARQAAEAKQQQLERERQRAEEEARRRAEAEATRKPEEERQRPIVEAKQKAQDQGQPAEVTGGQDLTPKNLFAIIGLYVLKHIPLNTIKAFFDARPIRLIIGTNLVLLLVVVLTWTVWIRVLPLQTFRDCDVCPEIVVQPGGAFLMGSPENEEGRDTDEGPQHEVTIQPFAIGKHEVTFEEWDACVSAGGCNSYRPDDQGWGRGRRPVINVSWRDARAYCEWLAKETGKPYRLPSEAEWEYAARAGTTTRYAFGDEITEKEANFRENVGKTTEVGAYPANAWRLYDMHGNVWEWVEDVWHDSYVGAPADGSAWIESSAEAGASRVLRGGSWRTFALRVRSASRRADPPDNRYDNLGLRCARVQ
jgi:formylglycine-generating enzyme required for sulfatase activity